MNRLLIVRPEAEADISDAAVWYDGREPGLGMDLISEVSSAISRALTNPESFSVFGEIQKFVVFSLDVFPIAFSTVRSDAIVVFAILHAARHDRIWKHRAQGE
jgi:toxin ParE1/3/4